MKRSTIRVMVLVALFLVLVLLALMASSERGKAHQAASGMKYDSGCCSDRDCREIPSTAVRFTAGGWLVNATGEVIPERQVKTPTDGKFHRCTYSDGTTRCLYVPPFGS